MERARQSKRTQERARIIEGERATESKRKQKREQEAATGSKREQRRARENTREQVEQEKAGGSKIKHKKARTNREVRQERARKNRREMDRANINNFKFLPHMYACITTNSLLNATRNHDIRCF